jgi:hypothetical protein
MNQAPMGTRVKDLFPVPWGSALLGDSTPTGWGLRSPPGATPEGTGLRDQPMPARGLGEATAQLLSLAELLIQTKHSVPGDGVTITCPQSPGPVQGWAPIDPDQNCSVSFRIGGGQQRKPRPETAT